MLPFGISKPWFLRILHFILRLKTGILLSRKYYLCYKLTSSRSVFLFSRGQRLLSACQTYYSNSVLYNEGFCTMNHRNIYQCIADHVFSFLPSQNSSRGSFDFLPKASEFLFPHIRDSGERAFQGIKGCRIPTEFGKLVLESCPSSILRGSMWRRGSEFPQVSLGEVYF